MSNITSCDSGSFSTENINTTGVYAAVVVKQQPPEILGHLHSPNSHTSTTTATNNSNGSNTNSQPPIKKKRSLPGNPDPSAEVIALSPNTLVTTNRFICEICNKGFQRDQNLQLHRRGHNLPWKLKQRSSTEVVRKRVYVCPEPSCVHHNPARALGDLTGIKKHFSRKHGEKKWKCDKCSKKYAVQSDWKAHSKICGTKEYKCDCGTIFSRRDSFITHRAFCDALAEENNKMNEGQTQLSKKMGNSNCMLGQSNIPVNPVVTSLPQIIATPEFNKQYPLSSPPAISSQLMIPPPHGDHLMTAMPAATAKPFHSSIFNISPSLQLSSSNYNMLLLEAENGVHSAGSPHMSATALLQKAAQMGATMSSSGVREKEAGGFVTTTTSMAPPSFSTELQQQPYEMIMNRYMQQHDQQDISLSTQYNNNNNNFNNNGMNIMDGGMSGLDMFNAILDQSKALSKIIEQNNINIIRSSSSSADCALNNNGRSVSSSNNNIAKGSDDDHGHGDVMTLDLLGIGGGGSCSAHGNFYGGGGQHSGTAARDHDFGAGFQSFSATSSI